MNNLRNLALWIVIALLLVFLFNLFQQGGTHTPAQSLSYYKFTELVAQDQIKTVKIQGDNASGQMVSGQQYTTAVPANDPTLWPALKAHKVDATVAPTDENFNLLAIFINWFPMLLIFGVWVIFLRQMQSGGGKAMGFGKSRA